MLATALVSVAVFDRESNVRRAASAAYQEHVGRHSAFPHGISVLQLADFFSVGNMRNAFVVASRKISEFAEYREPLLHHLCTVTIYHWDLKTRELAVEALRELAPLAPEYMATRLLPEMPQSITVDFTVFVDTYGITPDQHARIVHHVQEGGPGSSREGFVLALGALRTPADFEMLCNLITEGATVEIRRDAGLALGQFGQRALEQGGRMCDGDILAAVGALLSGLHDRTVDNRGDVGSWVRQQCLCSLQHLFTVDSRVLTCVCSDSDLALRLLGRILHAATEKIDRLRASAGLLLESFLYGQRGMHAHGTDKPDADTVVERCIEELRAFIPRGQLEDSRGADSKGISWADSESAYGQLVYALSVSEESLRKLLFEGFVVAGSAEPMGKFAVNAVAAYAGTLPAADRGLGPGWTVDGIIAELTRLLLTDKQTSRLINPALIVSDQLIEQGALLAASPKVLRAPQRLMLCVKLYGSLALVSSEVARLAGDSLLAHIGHPIPKIRQVAADQLYTMLCINGVVADIDEECETSLREIERLLSETEWMQDTDSVKASRGRLAELVRQVLRDKSVPR
ncbi:hypothetical protein GGH91_000036 [Coemansia sp. RSA 2671]|nr:hypothetical protein GGH91_000036 [Coemansia sp. RSA 2671]